MFIHNPSFLWSENPPVLTKDLRAFFNDNQNAAAAFIIPTLPQDLRDLISSLDSTTGVSFGVREFINKYVSTICFTPALHTVDESSSVLDYSFGVVHQEPPRRTVLVAIEVQDGPSSHFVLDRTEAALIWAMHEAVHCMIYTEIANRQLSASMEADERWPNIVAKVLYEHFEKSVPGFSANAYGYVHCCERLKVENMRLKLPPSSMTLLRAEDKMIASLLPTFIADRL